MAFDYARATATASRLIENFGRQVTLRTPGAPTGPDYDPTPGTPTDETLNAADLQRSITNRQDSVVQVGDKLMVIEQPANEITTSSIVIVGGVEWRVVDASPLAPADVVVYVELLLRK